MNEIEDLNENKNEVRIRYICCKNKARNENNINNKSFKVNVKTNLFMTSPNLEPNVNDIQLS